MTYKTYELLGLDTRNIAKAYDAYDLYDRIVDTGYDYGHIADTLSRSTKSGYLCDSTLDEIDEEQMSKNKKIQFGAVVGNPPYQETKGGTKNIDIWQHFVNMGIELADEACFIHPARWVVPKKNMKKVRDELLSKGLKGFDIFPNSYDIFPEAAVDGGISITTFKAGFSGDIHYSVKGESMGTYASDSIFFANEYEKEIFDKISADSLDVPNIAGRVFGNIGSLGGSEYGYKKSEHIQYLKDSPSDMQAPLAIWANATFGRGSRFGWYYIDQANINSVPSHIVSSRKVMLDKKGNSCANKKGNVINNIPQIVDAHAIASGDVLFIKPEKDETRELQIIKSLFMTKTIRYLMCIIQKDLYVRGFELIPDYTYFMTRLDANDNIVTDKWLYETFDFSSELIQEIETKVSPKNE